MRTYLLCALACILPFHIAAQTSLIDATFQTGSGFSAGNVRTAEVFSNGHILIGGSFNAYDGQPAGRCIMIGENGESIQAFNSNLGTGFNGEVYQIRKLNSGKIIICGDFTEFNGELAPRIIRLNENGTRDTEFQPGIGANNRINAVLEQSNGSLIIGGRFTEFNGVAINRLARINEDGSVDLSFNNNGGASSEVVWLEKYQDDRFLAGGNFININGTSCGRVARLLPDGTIDPGFISSPNANATVQQLKLMNDDKIIIAGFFTQVSGNLVSGIARLLPDGAFDSSFNSAGNGATGGGVLSFDIAPNGNILLGGSFTAFNGLNAGYLFFLDSNGTPVNLLNSALGTAADWNVLNIKFDNSDRWLIGGLFSNFDGQQHNRLVRVFGSTTVQLNPTPEFAIKIYPNPAQDWIEIEIMEPANQLLIYSISGQVYFQYNNLIPGKISLPITQLNNGIYWVSLEGQTGIQTRLISIN